MTTPSWSTSPFPNPLGDAVFDPKVLGQSSRVRTEISQNSTIRVGLQIIIDGEATDPEFIQAIVFQKTDFNPEAPPIGIALEPVRQMSDLNYEDVGVYSFTLDPDVTQYLSHVTIVWEYSVDNVTYRYVDYYQINGYMPVYETLNEGEKGVLRTVAAMFEDLYDSEEGGPHLKAQFQSHFGSERIAQCMELAMSRINRTSQPYTNYNIGFGTGPRFPAQYYSILIMGTYLEVVRHLIRSYTEMPTMSGSPGVAYYDRSNYVSRWRDVLQDEQEDYKAAVASFKRSLLNLGGGALIVSGGIYGNAAYWRSGTYSAQVRASRFAYPASVVQVRPGGA